MFCQPRVGRMAVMLEKQKMARSKKSNPTASGSSPFRAAVEQVLRHANDLGWIAEHSPLASAYLVSGDGRLGQARALLQQLQAVAAALPARPEARFAPARLLALTYFNQHQTKNQTGIALELELSPATYYRQREEAIDALAAALAQAINPVLRSEQPAPPGLLAGRQNVFDACLAAFERGRCVAITGGAGSGKTSLGAALVQAWQADQPQTARAFWFTVRRGINDHISAFLTGLAHVLQQTGDAALIGHLLASPGRADTAIALSLARESLDRTRLLLCLDEADALNSGLAETESSAQLRSFLEALLASPRGAQSGFPVLLLGQQLLLEPDVHFVLEGLPRTELARVLAAQLVVASDEQLSALQLRTRGNPLMLKLCLALVRGGETLDDALRQLMTAPSLGLLWTRVRRNLTVLERDTLALLSILRGFGPPELVDAVAPGLRRLLDQGLLQSGNTPGVMLLPALAAVVSDDLDADTRLRLHAQAAEMRAAHAELTEAAHHWVQAGDAGQAVRAWHENRVAEINRGAGPAARIIFRQVARDALPVADRKRLTLIRAELDLLLGEASAAAEGLEAVRWQRDDPLTARARQLQGDARAALGDDEGAQEAYRHGIVTLDLLRSQREADVLAVGLRARAGGSALRSGQTEAAATDAQEALYMAHTLAAQVREREGQLGQAQALHAQALAHADAAGNPRSAALARMNLAVLLGRGQDGAAAVKEFNRAIAAFRALGDVAREHRAMSNLAAIHVYAGQHAEAVQVATHAAEFFERVGQPGWAAMNYGNGAEAHAGLGNWDAAEQLAMRAINLEDAPTRAYALTVLARAALARGQADRAQQLAQSACDEATALDDRWAEAGAQLALGQACRAAANATAAHAAFARAASLFDAVGATRDAEIARAAAHLTSSLV